MAAVTIKPKEFRPLPGYLSVKLVAGEALNVGDLVYVGGDGKAYKADNGTAAAAAFVGFVLDAPNGATSVPAGRTFTVALPSSVVTGFSGLTPGAYLYVGTAGVLEDAAPGTGEVKPAAIALSVTDALILSA